MRERLNTKLIAVCVLWFAAMFARASHFNIPDNSARTSAFIIIIDTGTEEIVFNSSQLNDNQRPRPLLQKLEMRRKKNKRITAAILAFPFPFGIVGLHRIYLGCAPYVPVVYIASIGGAFGILPFIDFCMLVLDKDIDRYQNNNNVFMWAR